MPNFGSGGGFNNNQPIVPQPQTFTVYPHFETTNKSFLNMHYFLKEKGIKNNKFMLALYDPDLAGINPHDPNLNFIMKQKVMRECQRNYWYFLRECVRIPVSGATGSGAKYELHRGNLAMNFCMCLNLNIFFELPRQRYKTVSALCRYLYLFNFGTTNSEMAFLHIQLKYSKANLQTFKDLREALPSYLRMDQTYTRDGKKLKAPNTVETLQHPFANNKIRTVASARSEQAAANLLRGRSLPLIWADEWAFVPYNSVVYSNTAPAFKTVADIARRNGTAYGILITTTPGFLTTDEGIAAFNMKENATKFDESWYDMTYDQIMTLIRANVNSDFVYIRFTYQQLGCSEEWFREICKLMLSGGSTWADIRREVLLEWSNSVKNSPFTQEQLEVVSQLTMEPKRKVLLLGKYYLNIYNEIDTRRTIPIMGVDVSGGYSRDSSAITLIDPTTTKPFADLNCNYIPTDDLSLVILAILEMLPAGCVINIERNGGFGASVIGNLMKTKAKKYLYYEIKERELEEAADDRVRNRKRKQKVKVYGFDNTPKSRELLMEILKERMEYHKDKFVSKQIYEELIGLEYKKNGRIDHSSNTHDDQIFSYLLALYVWYYGVDIRERYGIQKNNLVTDQDSIDEVVTFEEKKESILDDMGLIDTPIDTQLKEMHKAKGMLYHEWEAKEKEKDEAALKDILMFRPAKEAYMRQYNMTENDIEMYTRDNGEGWFYQSIYSDLDDDSIFDEDHYEE